MGHLGYQKPVCLSSLSDAAISVAVEQLPRRQSSMSFMPIHPLGGAFTAVAEDAAAFGGPRQPVIAFNIAAIAPTRELLDADRAWAPTCYDRLRPYAADAGSYVNFMTEFEDDRVRATFGDAKYLRLARIKASYDPDNVFRHNVNIRPEFAAATIPSGSAARD